MQFTDEEIEALEELMDNTVLKEVEEGQRVYTSSATYGISRYHLIDKEYDVVSIEQIETNEKWSKRVVFGTDESKVLLACLLKWHLADSAKKQQEPESLDELDDHPF